MLKKFLVVLGVFGFAFTILAVSVLDSCSVSYSFAAPEVPPLPEPSPAGSIPKIDYQLPYPGNILPGNLLWDLKALRDKVWYTITFSPLKKAELALLFSDKRLVMSRDLLSEGKINDSVTTLTKGEKYLEISMNEEKIAAKKGDNVGSFLEKIATASLKHREVIEEMTPMFPEQAKPLIIETENYPKASFKKAGDALNSRGLPVPKNPFLGD